MEVGSGGDGNSLDMHPEAWPAEGQQSAEDCSLLNVGEGTRALCHCTWGRTCEVSVQLGQNSSLLPRVITQLGCGLQTKFSS